MTSPAPKRPAPSDPAPFAVLGLGAMGHAMVVNALRAGLSKIMWNRGPERTRDLEGRCCIESARRLPDGRETSDGRFVRPVIGRIVRFAYTISLVGSQRCVRFASNATVPEAAVWAPSAVNAQPWAFGIIRDRSLLDRYAERAKAIYLTDPLVAELAATPEPVLRHLREALSQPGYDVFHGARTLITIYATAPRDVPDCFLAGENLMLAAHATGLGTCPIGLSLPLMNQQDVKDELGVAVSFVAALPIVVGHPAEQPHATRRNPPSVIYRR